MSGCGRGRAVGHRPVAFFGQHRNLGAPLALSGATRSPAMLTTTPRIKFVDEPTPMGDVPLAPAAATGRSEAELARAMAERLPQRRAQPPFMHTLAGTLSA